MAAHLGKKLMQIPERNIAVILLAAGPSSRLGQAKQLVQYKGQSLVRKSVRLLQSLEPREIIVVTGCESERVEQEIADLPVEVIYNRRWEQGMGASIACGARQASKSVDGVLLMVCDQWLLEADDLSRLISAWLSDISRIYVACWFEAKAHVSGPPVLFPRKLVRELQYVHENRGARQVIDQHMDMVEFVSMENAAFDVDRPEDLEELP
jgi:molybdenum cofactor cytidylyltransferase